MSLRASTANNSEATSERLQSTDSTRDASVYQVYPTSGLGAFKRCWFFWSFLIQVSLIPIPFVYIIHFSTNIYANYFDSHTNYFASHAVIYKGETKVCTGKVDVLLEVIRCGLQVALFTTIPKCTALEDSVSGGHSQILSLLGRLVSLIRYLVR